jgi:imidazolonepropionase-like amidohydrolase
MNWHQRFSVVLFAGLAALSGRAQTAGKYLAPRDQLIAIRAGRLFDARSGTILTNQVVIVRSDRIAEVGSGLAIPSGANVIDLSNATVMPGMIDAHVHINTGGESEAQRTLIALANAQIDLAAGFTTILDMDSRGGYNTVDIRDQINSGRVQGPRMQVVGESLNPRATNYYPDIRTGRFQEGFIENMNVNGPWLARAAVREAKLHGVDWVKIYTTQDFVGTMHMWTPEATLVNSPSLAFEEVQAIVDEAHRLGLKVACHTYGGEGMASCINAGVDAPNHLLELDQDGIQVLLQKKLPFVATLDDLISLEKGDKACRASRPARGRCGRAYRLW